MTTNNISTVRQLLLDQMAALRSASTDTLASEIDRAKGMAEIAGAITNASRVEVDYLKTMGGGESAFLEPRRTVDGETPQVEMVQQDKQLPSGILSITRHRIAG